MKPKATKLNRPTALCSSAVLGIGLLFLFGSLTNGLSEIPEQCQAPSSLVSTQSRCCYNVHELGALNYKCLERWNLLKLSGGICELLCQLRATLELGDGNLQSKLSKMLPLLKTSGAICDGESAPNTERGANECGTGSDGGDKDNLSHIIVAGMIGCLSVIGGYLIGGPGCWHYQTSHTAHFASWFCDPCAGGGK